MPIRSLLSFFSTAKSPRVTVSAEQDVMIKGGIKEQPGDAQKHQPCHTMLCQSCVAEVLLYPFALRPSARLEATDRAKTFHPKNSAPSPSLKSVLWPSVLYMHR